MPHRSAIDFAAYRFDAFERIKRVKGFEPSTYSLGSVTRLQHFTSNLPHKMNSVAK